MHEDIIGGTPQETPQGWLAIGWFTPDYRPVAERFAANLTGHAIPFHLFARPKLTRGWNTQQKPSVVLAAMDAYPDKTLILMDVDCIVRGDIAPATEIAGGVGVILKARQIRKGREWQRRVAITLSSRVVVVRPTLGARAFLAEWEGQCASPHSRYGGDETAMTWAYLRCSDVAFSFLDDRFKGWEVNSRSLPDGAVIVHDSVHDKVLGLHSVWSGVRARLKAIERRCFRTGRTKRNEMARLG
jgi:hypothetical protein